MKTSFAAILDFLPMVDVIAIVDPMPTMDFISMHPAPMY